MKRRGILVGVLVVCMTMMLVISAGAVEPRTAPANSPSAPATYVPGDRATLLSEGFESAVPPTGWVVSGTHTDTETWYWKSDSSHTGSSSAAVDWDPELVPQDEWLVTPSIDMATGTLSFWSQGSLYWCRDDYDNCDLEVWLVVGAVGGGDDILLGLADDDWSASWVWSQSTFVLDANLPLNASIGFRYTGTDGAQINLDDVLVDGTLVPVELQRFMID